MTVQCISMDYAVYAMTVQCISMEYAVYGHESSLYFKIHQGATVAMEIY